jgi:proteasome lid subunit RPN8/RPN11
MGGTSDFVCGDLGFGNLVPVMIQLRIEDWGAMYEDVTRRAKVEACGLVAGVGGVSAAVRAIPNIHNSPYRFEMEPSAQVSAQLEFYASGWDLLAIYHSHPVGDAFPSETDVRAVAYPDVVYLIWARDEHGAWFCRGYWLGTGDIVPVVLGIVSEHGFPENV